LSRTTIYTRAPVGRIVRSGQSFVIDGRLGLMGPYQVVVLAVPAVNLASLLTGVDSRPEWPDAIQYHPRAVVGAIYPKHAFGAHLMLRHTGFVVAPDAGLGLAACTWLTTKWPYTADDEVIVMRTVWGPPGENPDQWTDSEIRARHHEVLTRVMGAHEPLQWIRVQRYDAAFPTVPAHLKIDPPGINPANEPYLGIVGPYFQGSGVSDCIRQAWQEADRIMAWIKLSRLLDPLTRPRPLSS
jgi:oxygen-dependent protoporphyrinogen oxidase